MTTEETIFKMVECANELYSYDEFKEAVLLLQSVDRLCDKHKIEMPSEAVSLNIQFDEHFDTDIFNYRPCHGAAVLKGNRHRS